MHGLKTDLVAFLQFFAESFAKASDSEEGPGLQSLSISNNIAEGSGSKSGFAPSPLPFIPV
jgi:hypothetical protein